jgi:DNA helicase TIP49 (TBP-interacting protein)
VEMEKIIRIREKKEGIKIEEEDMRMMGENGKRKKIRYDVKILKK